MMADLLQNATELNQNNNGKNNEEMEEVTIEGHKLITLHVTQEEKRILGATESTHDAMKVVKIIIYVWNKEKEEGLCCR